MQLGRVIRYDGHKGFGFIAPDAGGDDVFFHTSSISAGASNVRQGMVVEFDAYDSEQGRKALTVRVVRETNRSAAPAANSDADLCEVVSSAEFARKVTDVLLAAAPSLTGTQIIEIRDRLSRLASDRRWLD
jgi:cold shock protein